MNKVEFQQKLDESVRLIEEGNYQEAVDQIDLLNLDSVRDTRILQLIAKAYEKCRRYDDAEDLLLQAKEIAPRGRGTLFHLCTLAIKAGNIGDAMVYYNQFCDVAKNDSERFVLQYRIAQAENKGDDELITILENFKGEEPDDRWMYELAKLYAINDRTNEALEICDEITLWFYNGKYVQLAKELRAYLTGEPVEEERYEDSRETEVNNAGEKKAETFEASETEEQEKEPEAETIAETPETVISADAWDSDGLGTELFGGEKEEKTSEEEQTEARQKEEPEQTEDEDRFSAWTMTEPAAEKTEVSETVMEEPEEEQVLPGIDADVLSADETSAFAGMTGNPVPVEEEDRSETGRIMAEVPELPKGYRPTKADIYRIVPEFETIAEQAGAGAVLPNLSAFREVDEVKKETETATGTATETLAGTAAVLATAGLTEIAAKTTTGSLEAEFDLAELDRFTKAQMNSADEAMSKRIAEDEARKAEEETLKAEAEAEAARLAEEERLKAEAEAEAARLAEEERLKAEAEAEAARLAEEERLKAEAEAEAARIAEEERLKAEAEAEATRLAEEERLKVEAEAEAARIAEEERLKAEAEAEATKEAETESVTEEPSTEDVPEMETEVVTDLTPETEAKSEETVPENEPAKSEDLPEETEETEEQSAFAGMKVNPGAEDAYWHFIVVGENPEATLERAKVAMRTLSEREGLAEKMRMTKLPAAKLNGIQISAAFGQFRDKMVIIENASDLSDAQLEDFAALLPNDEHSMVLCLTDTKGNMASLFGRVNALAGSFDAVFEETGLTEDGIFKIIQDYFDAEDAVFTEEGEAAAREYVHDELLKAGNDAEALAKAFAEKVIHTAEHSGLFGLFSGRVDEEGFLHVTDKNVRKAIKK